MTEIKDPIHGYITLNEEEQKLLDTKPLQRLRRIKQLGFCNTVYPSANHSRFEHTLGVLYNTKQYLKTLDLSKQKEKELKTAAILHDTGHGPFSHLSERATGIDHEKLSCEIAEKLEDEYEADTERVKKIIRGELEIAQIIHGDVDADRLDYLQRDAYKTGINHGVIDSETIIRNAEMYNNQLVYNYKAIQALENLLVARLHMIKSVYHHHAALIAEKMVERAIEDNLFTNKIMYRDDYQADHILRPNPLYNRVMQRKLFKRTAEIKTEKTEEELEEEIAEKADVEKKWVIADKRQIGEDPENPGRNKKLGIKVLYNEEVTKLSKVSDIPEALSHYEQGTKIYSDREVKDKVEEAVKEIKK